MNEDAIKILSMVSAFIIVVPVLFAVRRLFNGDRVQKILAILIFVSLFFEVVSYVVGTIFHENNLILLHLFTIVELIFFVWLFYEESINLIPDKVIKMFVVVFVIYAIYYALQDKNYQSFNTYPRAIEGIVVISMIIAYFYMLLRSLKIVKLQKEALFWISVGALIYFSGGLFIFIFSNMILKSDAMTYTIWGIHACLNILLYIFYAIALWTQPNIET